MDFVELELPMLCTHNTDTKNSVILIKLLFLKCIQKIRFGIEWKKILRNSRDTTVRAFLTNFDKTMI